MKNNECYRSLELKGNVHVVMCDACDTVANNESSVETSQEGDKLIIEGPACANDDAPGITRVAVPFSPLCKEYIVNEGCELALPSSMNFVPELTITAHAGRVVADRIDTYKLTLETSSGGHVTLGGHAFVMIATNTSGSQCDCQHLICEGVKAYVHSGARLDVTVGQRIVADSPNGQINYYYLGDNLQAQCTGAVVKHKIELK